MNKKHSQQPDITIIVTAHNEGLIAHKTMLSVARACSLLVLRGYHYEILVSIDRGDDITREYFAGRRDKQPLTIYEWDFGDLAESRNATIKKAAGRYVSLIDADDLMSENWLADAVTTLDTKPYGTHIAHSSYTVEFGDADSIVVKYGATNQDQDTLLSVWAGRWNSVIIAPRQLFATYTYTPNSPGFGYEDWHMSCNFIQDNLSNILIPETVIFVRRKLTNSEWLRQKSSRSVLRAHPIFLPSNFKSLQLSDTSSPIATPHPLKQRLKHLATRSAITERVSRRAVTISRKIKQRLSRSIVKVEQPPQWLNDEWHQLHKIEKQIFPPSPVPAFHHTITEDHYKVGHAYYAICQVLHRDHYDYALFVPWLIPGGADLFAVSYANSAASLGKNVLVIGTNETDTESTWSTRLAPDVDFVPFGKITQGLAYEHKQRLLEQLIENTGTSIIHLLNSELGYEFVATHEAYLTATRKRIFATAYSQSTDDTGRVFGFSHTHIPKVYHLLEKLTTDNEAVRQMWISEYAYDPQRIIVHHQPLDAKIYPRVTYNDQLHGKILWAARLAPEKLPNLVRSIAELLPDTVTIDMYGSESPEFPASQLVTGDKVTYKGQFNGVASLPVNNYDLYLYTSLFDGMPNTPIEISLTGLPIVAAPVGGLPDFIGNDGFLATENTSASAYAESINQALSNLNEAQSRAKQLEVRARTVFSPENFREEVIELLGE